MTGYSAPNACAILSTQDGNPRLTMFAEEDDQHARTWSGPKLTPEMCKRVYQADVAYAFGELATFLKQTIADGKKIYVDHAPSNDCLDGECRSALSNAHDLKPFLHQLRVTKSSPELSVMNDGCGRAAKSLQATIEWTQQGEIREEHQLASKMEFECKQRGADDLAYVPVVASGSRALILHYTHNNQLIDASKLVLVDAGAFYKGYCSDISQDICTNGNHDQNHKD